jgi:hypothetical protein
MSYISNLTLALSVFSDKEIHAISVSKDDSDFYRIFYRMEGKNRVMFVPRKTVDAEQLQMEVAVQLKRSPDEQLRLGPLDNHPQKKAA